MPENNFLTATETAVALRVSPHVLALWRSNGAGPRFVRTSRGTIEYPAGDLAAWLAEIRERA